MTQLNKLWVLACVGVLVLMSCGKPATTEAPQSPKPPAPPTNLPLPLKPTTDPFLMLDKGIADKHVGDKDFIASACADIVTFDGDLAYNNAEASGETDSVLWTYGVNFNVIENKQPISCLKLYLRINPDPGQGRTQGTFEFYNQFLITNCNLIGDVLFSTPAKWAIFKQGYIECKMDLTTWVTSIANAETDPGQKERLQTFYLQNPQAASPVPRTTHSYGNLTMVARAAPSSVLDKATIMSSDASGTPLELLLSVADGSAPHFRQCDISGILSDQSNPVFQDWWYDLHVLLNQQGDLKYQTTAAVTPTPCDSISGQSKIDFSIGQSTLYIGGIPPSQNPAQTFQGVMDGILIDPTDSKPPK
jgi:hypothetical protein